MKNPFARDVTSGEEVAIASSVIGCWEHQPERVQSTEPLAWIAGELHPDMPATMAAREIEPANAWYDGASVEEYNLAQQERQ